MSPRLAPPLPGLSRPAAGPSVRPTAPVPLRPGQLYRLDSAEGPLVRLLDVSGCGQFARVETRRLRCRYETRAGRLLPAASFPARHG